MTREELDILTNIIGAVETGGQIYGKRRYECYVPPYHNSAAEHTCTLGWAGNYGYNAKKLVKMIFDEDKNSFRKVDSAHIEEKLKADWVATKWNPNNAEKKALITIITTPVGKKCQDELFHESIKKYVAKAEEFGVLDIKAQMMWCEIQHLGGLGPTKRIFQRAKKPYTPDSIFDSLLQDQKDSKSNNQVGDKKFQSRHECCVRWIKKYVEVEEEKNMGTLNGLINKALAEEGYIEKATNNQLDSKTANRGTRNYTKYSRDVNNWGLMGCQAQPWCITFQFWLEVKEFGLEQALKNWHMNKNSYVGYSCFSTYNKFPASMKSKKPKVGAVVIFTQSHAGRVVKVNGNTFTTIEGNTSPKPYDRNGGMVAKKTYSVNDKKIKGFLLFDYCSGTNVDKQEKPQKPTQNKPLENTSNNIAKGQKWLNKHYKDVIVKATKKQLSVDGSYGEHSRWGALSVWKDIANRKHGANLTLTNKNFYDSCKKVAKKIIVKKGDSGTYTYLIQFILSAKGFYNGKMDAEYGNGTAQAVKEFQKSLKLEADGIVGADTWYKLFN